MEPAMSPALRAWRASGRTLTYGDYRIFVRDSGPELGKPTLLLIHGFPTASWDWHPLWDALAQQFRVIAPDLIGFGFSSKSRKHRYSLLKQADMIEALLHNSGVDQVHVLAHDYGDSVAQELLTRFEDRKAGKRLGLSLSSVVLLNGGIFPERHRPRLVQRLLASPLGFLVARALNQQRYEHSLSAVFGPQTKPGTTELADFWALTANDGGMRIAHKLIGYMAERRRHREAWVYAMQSTRVPLRFINGLLDPISGAHMVARYRELIAAPDVVELAGVGHYPQVEAPRLVLEACKSFWTRIGALR